MEQKVIQIIAGHLGIPAEDIETKHHFVDDLGSDSLDSVEIVLLIEEEFDIEIPDHEVEGIHTVANLINYVNANV